MSARMLRFREHNKIKLENLSGWFWLLGHEDLQHPSEYT